MLFRYHHDRTRFYHSKKAHTLHGNITVMSMYYTM